MEDDEESEDSDVGKKKGKNNKGKGKGSSVFASYEEFADLLEGDVEEMDQRGSKMEKRHYQKFNPTQRGRKGGPNKRHK